MKMSKMLVEDTKATRLAILESKGLQSSGYTMLEARGSYEGKSEASLVLYSIDFSLLVGIAAIIVLEREQLEVWLVDSENTVWIVRLEGLVASCKNTSNGASYSREEI